MRRRDSLSSLPPRVVCVLDSDLKFCKDLSDRLPRLLPAEVSLRTYNSAAEARKQLRKCKKGLAIEPCVIVTDSIGTSPEGQSVIEAVRRDYPLGHVILHSSQADEKEVVRLFVQNLIHGYVPKPQMDCLAARVVEHLDTYERQSGLNLLREYIKRCDQPNQEFLQHDDGRSLSLTAVYLEILSGSDFGRELYTIWEEIAVDRTLKSSA